jgi:hypothetical protein
MRTHDLAVHGGHNCYSHLLLKFVPSGDWDLAAGRLFSSRDHIGRAAVQKKSSRMHVSCCLCTNSPLEPGSFGCLPPAASLSSTYVLRSGSSMLIPGRGETNPRARVIYCRFRTACAVAFASSFYPPWPRANATACHGSFVSACLWPMPSLDSPEISMHTGYNDGPAVIRFCSLAVVCNDPF